jgi:hypothetical protein
MAILKQSEIHALNEALLITNIALRQRMNNSLSTLTMCDDLETLEIRSLNTLKPSPLF